MKSDKTTIKERHNARKYILILGEHDTKSGQELAAPRTAWQQGWASTSQMRTRQNDNQIKRTLTSSNQLNQIYGTMLNAWNLNHLLQDSRYVLQQFYCFVEVPKFCGPSVEYSMIMDNEINHFDNEIKNLLPNYSSIITEQGTFLRARIS